MFKKVALTIVMTLVLSIVISSQISSVRAEVANELTAPISSPISVKGRVIYEYNERERPVIGAWVVIKNPNGKVVKTVGVNKYGIYTASASGYPYYFVSARDQYGTVFYPKSKKVYAGQTLSNLVFEGYRKP